MSSPAEIEQLQAEADYYHDRSPLYKAYLQLGTTEAQPLVVRLTRSGAYRWGRLFLAGSATRAVCLARISQPK